MRTKRISIVLPPDILRQVEKISAIKNKPVAQVCSEEISKSFRNKVSDRTTMLRTIGKMDKNIYKLQDRLIIIEMILEQFVRYYFVHTPELDEEAKNIAWENSKVRLEKFISVLALVIEESPSLLNRAVMQFLEKGSVDE